MNSRGNDLINTTHEMHWKQLNKGNAIDCSAL